MKMTMQTAFALANNPINGWSYNNDNDGKTNHRITQGNLQKKLVDKIPLCSTTL